MTNAKSILLSGGVSANTKLREKMAAMVKKDFPSTDLHIPPVALCTDNAAYIGSYAYYRSHPVSWKTIDAKPDLSVEITE